MNARYAVLGGVSVVALGGGLWWSSRRPVSPEEAVRRQVIKLTRAAEERDVAGVMDEVSQRFRSEDGWGRDELKGYLAGQMLSGRWLKIFLTRSEVEVKGPGEVDFVGTFVFGQSKAKTVWELAKEARYAAERVDATFEREDDGEWRVVRAAHQPVSQAELMPTGAAP
jgi:hypothetical protein